MTRDLAARDFVKRLVALGFCFGMAILAGLSVGCAHQEGLLTPGVKRVCTGWYCYITAPKDLVNTRCLDRKAAWKICQNNPNRKECAGVVAQWDDGAPKDPQDPTRAARACTVLRPKRADDHLRYWIWISEGEEISIGHEMGHIEIYEQDGFRYIPEHHKRLHGFGLDKEKGRL